MLTSKEQMAIRILRAYERRKFVGETFTCGDLIDMIPCSNHCMERSFTGAEMMVGVREGVISVVGTKEIDLKVPTKKVIPLPNGYQVVEELENAKVNIYKANYTVGEYKMKLITEIMAE